MIGRELRRSLDAEQWLIISPHFDDAVLSCASLLEEVKDVHVFTMFGGDGPPAQPVLEWDRDCGFSSPSVAMETRRLEEVAALGRLRATYSWANELQEGYRSDEPDSRHLERLLDTAVHAVHPANVLIPLGLAHNDHRLVSDASFAAATKWGQLRVFAYSERPYWQRNPRALVRRVGELRRRGVGIRSYGFRWRTSAVAREAMGSYSSQLRGLNTTVNRICLTPEHYWSVS